MQKGVRMKIKFLALLISFMFLMLILFGSNIYVIAEDGKKENTQGRLVPPGESYKLTVKTGAGELNYSWAILNFSDDELDFRLTNKDNNKILKAVSDNESYSDAFSVQLNDEFVFEWTNMNTKDPINIKYTIIYPKTAEIGSGCYSAILVLSIILLSTIFLAFGYFKKRYGSSPDLGEQENILLK